MKFVSCNCDAKPMCIDSRVCHTHRRRRYKCPQCGALSTSVEIPVGNLANESTTPLAKLEAHMQMRALDRFKFKLVEIIATNNIAMKALIAEINVENLPRP